MKMGFIVYSDYTINVLLKEKETWDKKKYPYYEPCFYTKKRVFVLLPDSRLDGSIAVRYERDPNDFLINAKTIKKYPSYLTKFLNSK